MYLSHLQAWVKLTRHVSKLKCVNNWLKLFHESYLYELFERDAIASLIILQSTSQCNSYPCSNPECNVGLQCLKMFLWVVNFDLQISRIHLKI